MFQKLTALAFAGLALGFAGCPHPLHLLRITEEDRQGASQTAHLVPALRAGYFDIGMPFGNQPHAAGDGGQRPGDAAADHQGDRRDDDQEDQGDGAAFPRPRGKQGIDVVQVDARSDDPAPFRKAAHEGNLIDRLDVVVLFPLVAHEARAVLEHHPDGLAEHGMAIGIDDAIQPLSIQLRLERVHHHDVVHVLDPEVLVKVVAQGLQLGQRRSLRVGAGHGAGAFLSNKMLDHAMGDFDDMLRLGHTVFGQAVPQLPQAGAADSDHAEHDDQ